MNWWNALAILLPAAGIAVYVTVTFPSWLAAPVLGFLILLTAIICPIALRWGRGRAWLTGFGLMAAALVAIGLAVLDREPGLKQDLASGYKAKVNELRVTVSRPTAEAEERVLDALKTEGDVLADTVNASLSAIRTMPTTARARAILEAATTIEKYEETIVESIHRGILRSPSPQQTAPPAPPVQTSWVATQEFESEALLPAGQWVALGFTAQVGAHLLFKEVDGGTTLPCTIKVRAGSGPTTLLTAENIGRACKRYGPEDVGAQQIWAERQVRVKYAYYPICPNHPNGGAFVPSPQVVP